VVQKRLGSEEWRAPLWRVWLASIAALILLNATLTFENVWPTPKIRWANAISIELTVAVLLLALLWRWARGLSRVVLPLIWVTLVVGHYLDVTAPGLYGREFNLYWDSQHLGNVMAMLTRSAPTWLMAAAAAALLLSVWAFYAVSRLALRQLAAAVERPIARRLLAGAASVLIVIFAGQRLLAQPAGLVTFADPVTAAYARQVRFVLAMMGPQTIAPALAPSPDLNSSLEALDGADVLLVFVESYGAVTYETPAIADGLVESRAELAAAARETDRVVLSAYVDSPTFGASSWLAHLTLISGVDVRDQYSYTALMASSRDTLVTSFSRRGYRTVALMPGMRQAWPEGAFYRYDQIYGSELLEYSGPQFGWWTIPDQWALAKLDALERSRPSRSPLFVVFPTSTSHAPFGPVAPYVPDWSRVLSQDAWSQADVETAMYYEPDYLNLRPSYVHAIAYEYRALAGYLRQHPSDDMVLIAIGDHQPPAAVSGRDASWSVPVHVVARRGAVADRLMARGFRAGITPQRPALGPMRALTPMLLDAFGSLPADTRAGVRQPAATVRPRRSRRTRPAAPASRRRSRR
jgi:hypothetical protein